MLKLGQLVFLLLLSLVRSTPPFFSFPKWEALNLVHAVIAPTEKILHFIAPSIVSFLKPSFINMIVEQVFNSRTRKEGIQEGEQEFRYRFWKKEAEAEAEEGFVLWFLGVEEEEEVEEGEVCNCFQGLK